MPSTVLLAMALTVTPHVMTAASSTVMAASAARLPCHDKSSCSRNKRANQHRHGEEQKGAQHGGQPRVPFTQEILMTADAATEHGVGHGAALRRDAAGRQHANDDGAAEHDPAQQMADVQRRRLNDAGFVIDAEADRADSRPWPAPSTTPKSDRPNSAASAAHRTERRPSRAASG